MTPLAFSSGNLLADRRADYAEMLFANGDPNAAAELLVSALELAPDWASGWFRAGEMHEAAGQAQGAIEAWRMALAVDPADRMGAALKLELACARPGGEPAGAPGAFVETLFDQYAESFDDALVNALHYRVPQQIEAALRVTGRAPFAAAVDLGCGTGLIGERLRSVAVLLHGYDISAGMLRKAAERGLYDRLEKADLNALVLPPASADLIVAADVSLYIGPLDRLVGMSAGALRPGGLLAFSVEALDGDSFKLLPSRRYAHSEAYVRRLLPQSGLDLVSSSRDVIRRDRDADVAGLIFVAEKST